MYKRPLSGIALVKLVCLMHPNCEVGSLGFVFISGNVKTPGLAGLCPDNSTAMSSTAWILLVFRDLQLTMTPDAL